MTVDNFLVRLRACPLIASVQASDGSPFDHPDTLLRAARASLRQGVRVIRLEGVKNARVMRPEVKGIVIGLLKRRYPGSEVYITPTAQDADSMIELGCEVIAIDGTSRARPGNDTLADLIAHIHRRRKLVLADIDTVESAEAAVAAGADMVSTTLGGYTGARDRTDGPDLELLRAVVQRVRVPVMAEGRFTARWEVEAALRIGAKGVVVGGALNDPVKQTAAMLPRVPASDGKPVGAVDIGGTWLRFATFSADWKLQEVDRTPNPPARQDRLDWIRAKLQATGVERLGVSTGGIVDPNSGEVWTAKEYLMPDHIGIRFHAATLGVPTVAIGDGHATAWAHACLPEFAGRRVATLALGTGVGAGFVQQGKIWCGRRGEYPRINDLPTRGGASYEERLGGIHLSKTPDDAQRGMAIEALEDAISVCRNLYFSDDIVIAGSVGLSDWMAPHHARLGVTASPFGSDAGLYGAAALVLFPPGWDPPLAPAI
ncbi:MAG: putative N-acetylmannosamine-6-phosphate 2-epimerase [Fimbriimonadaceae bacterium]|nr:putative N-acetylmannosamine-6-phosphate 2-epimerase [Fimbriimonadaceae bacterium]